MSAIGRRYTQLLSILVGLAAIAIFLLLVMQWILPSVFGHLPSWLPEDTLAGLGTLFVVDMLGWFPALAFSSLLLTFSYWLRPEELPPGEAGALVRFSILAVGVTVVFAALVLLAQPWTTARLDELRFRELETRQLEDAYLKLKEKGSEGQTWSDLSARLNLLQRLGQLRPMQGQMGGRERMDYDFELQILKAHFELEEFFRLRTLDFAKEPQASDSSSVSDLLDQAEAALADGTSSKEYLANHWALMAYRQLANAQDQRRVIDNKALLRSKRVVDESWARIYEKTLLADERLKASYFFRKGKSLGDFQFQNYLEAYYGFQELYRENPRDAEVKRYQDLSLEKVQGQVLFTQDMDVLFAVPASQNLVFVNSDKPTEVVRVGKLLNTSQGVYVRDFELLRFDSEGRTLLHWQAPYGRWDDTGIDFRAWDKDKPEPHFPVVFVETERNQYNPLSTVDPPVFRPRVSVHDLELVNASQTRPQTLGTWDLLVHGRSIETLGYNSRIYQTEFLLRLGSPFGFFVAFLLVFALAWKNRAKDPGRGWWFLVPILPFVSEFVVETIVWLSRLSIGGLVAVTGIEATAGTLVLLFVVSSVLSMILIQLQFHKHRT